jgi:predicted Holliday junction resolvase-like endonuclease
MRDLNEEQRQEKMRERERAEAHRRKEQQVKRMDDMKRLMIADIMRRSNTMIGGRAGTAGTPLSFYDELCFGVNSATGDKQSEEEAQL